MGRVTVWVLVAALGLVLAACGDDGGAGDDDAGGGGGTTSGPATPTTGPPATGPAPTVVPTTAVPTTVVPTTAVPTTTAPPTTTTRAPVNATTPRPAWLGTRVLPLTPAGFGEVQPTPPELADRRFATIDLLPPPADDAWAATVDLVPDDVAARSTWTLACPVALGDLRYLTVAFRGFDGLAHTGELLVAADVVDDVVEVFRQLFVAGYPIEEMRVASQADLDAPPTGDGNDTTAFACRPVVGSTSWSEHAYGRAVDVNPFQNPYVRGDVVLPELASAYLDRDPARPGVIVDGDAVVDAFRSVGWGWGGDFTSLVDWMHFSRNGG